MSEIQRIQQEIADMNRAAGKPAGTRLRRPIDEEGYEISAEAPPQQPQPETSQPKPPQPVATIPAYQMPVQVVDLKDRRIYGSIGTFPLEEEDIDEFRAVAAKAMRRVIDAIGNPPKRQKASAEEKPSPAEPRTSKRRNRNARSATGGTGGSS